ncbi:unnamed protein product [Trichobilharzia szidati]|nr:unnamed protein product [Trichobilharzia szidati]
MRKYMNPQFSLYTLSGDCSQQSNAFTAYAHFPSSQRHRGICPNRRVIKPNTRQTSCSSHLDILPYVDHVDKSKSLSTQPISLDIYEMTKICRQLHFRSLSLIQWSYSAPAWFIRHFV